MTDRDILKLLRKVQKEFVQRNETPEHSDTPAVIDPDFDSRVQNGFIEFNVPDWSDETTKPVNWKQQGF
jgi:hypothetical protein